MTAREPHPGRIEQLLRVGILDAIASGGHTQRWLADQVGISEKHMSLMLTGRAVLSLRLAEQMLATLGRTASIEIREAPDVRNMKPPHAKTT